ncbi:glycosyltransferase family 2 protein [Chloroflexota bacterium]
MPDKISVIIPAFNEEASIGRVISDIPAKLAAEVVVVDNGSTDATAETARKAGATVVRESRRGYGSACLKGMEYIENSDGKPDIVVFLDGDYSDYPEEITGLVKPVIEQGYEMVIGSRLLGMGKKRTMPFHQYMGNRLLTLLIRALYRFRFTDLGPFRAIRYDKLKQLEMRDRDYGWTAEMQVKAVKEGLSITEVPVSYRPRIGKSKISGTVKGSMLALYKILVVIFKNV